MTNRQILKRTFLMWAGWDKKYLQRLKKYVDSGKKFLCGKNWTFYCKDNCG